MKKLYLLAAMIFIYACQHAQEKSGEFPPQWSQKIPQSETVFFAVGFGKSISEEIAFEKAQLQAYKQLAELVGTIQKEARGNKTKTTVEATLKEITIVAKAVSQDSAGFFETYVLVSHPKSKN